ncbi:MAG: 30S ribosomal protein S3 [Christensenellales bacterium]|jgi:small subunit ribosomal protein S3
MGQKVHPNGARVGIIRDWDTRWFAAKKDFAKFLIEDKKVRDYLKEKLYASGVSRVEIERAGEKLTVGIHTAKPGIIIGKGGAGVTALKNEVEKLTGRTVNLNIYEVRNPDIDAQLIAENIASQLERRISFRRAMKQAIGRAMKNGAKGIKTQVSGRLGGAEIARSEGYHEGSIPLQTLRANIEYGFAEAKTTYGRIGCKVWVYRGEVLPGSGLLRASDQSANEPPRRFQRRRREGGR